MINITNSEVIGFDHAIRGMRNPMNSWAKTDSMFLTPDPYADDMGEHIIIGEKDHELMMRLAKGGPVHAKYRRMITVYADILAPLYWWKEFDTYKVGTVANSCSTMHKIHSKEFTIDDFSHEYLNSYIVHCALTRTVELLNTCREAFLKTKDKKYWWQIIQMLPSSYNQKRTVMLNYEVLANIYRWRKDHKLDEWREFCKWIENLPYSEIIFGELYNVFMD